MDSNKSITLGELIYRTRKAQFMSQDELADVSNIGRNHMSKIENDHVKPTYKKTCAIAKTLGIRPSILFNKMGEMADQEMDDNEQL